MPHLLSNIKLSLTRVALFRFPALSFHRVAFKDRLTEIEVRSNTAALRRSSRFDSNQLTGLFLRSVVLHASSQFAISVLDRLNLYKPSPSRSGASTPTNLDRFIVSPLTTPGSSRPPTPVLDRISHSLGFHHSHKLNAQHRNSSSSSYLQDSEILPTVRPKEDDEKESQTEFADLARGVKNVVLHDARNIKGKDGRISGKSLAFDVANASAAKVSPSSPSFFARRYLDADLGCFDSTSPNPSTSLTREERSDLTFSRVTSAAPLRPTRTPRRRSK